MQNDCIAIIGLGYVGLPLAVEFAKQYPTIGFDINKRRIQELEKGLDRTREVEEKELNAVLSKSTDQPGLVFHHELEGIKGANIYIVTVPTPIDKNKRPDLRPLLGASHTVGKVLKKGDIVIYESTVYPGCTEEDCVPILEAESGLLYNQDFYCGYSPERINPGDKVHTVTKIRKVTSGSTPEIAKKVDALYSSIIEAGTFSAASIKVAEAAKVIENCQRDINIAFVNELALIFNKMDIDTLSVLEAAGTKWNFLPFKPGLVGGHCIGVDPYYLTHKAEELNYFPQVILSGRRINDSMGATIANRLVKMLIKNHQTISQSRVLVLGITFKENCPDIRNSRVIDIVRELQDFEAQVEVYDPWAEAEEVKEEYGLDLVSDMKGSYEAVVLAVAHEEFKSLDFAKMREEGALLFDVKGLLATQDSDARL